MRLLALTLLPNGIPAGTTFTADNDIQGGLLIRAGVAREADEPDERPRLIKRVMRSRATTPTE